MKFRNPLFLSDKYTFKTCKAEMSLTEKTILEKESKTKCCLVCVAKSCLIHKVPLFPCEIHQDLSFVICETDISYRPFQSLWREKTSELMT